MAKKIVLKKSGEGKKPVIRLNAPAPEEAPSAPAEKRPETPPAAPDDQAVVRDPKATMVAEVPGTGKPSHTAPTAKEAADFKFYCVYCGQKLSASSATAGKQIKCPACDRKITIPEPPTE